jgi:hypothetical protein
LLEQFPCPTNGPRLNQVLRICAAYDRRKAAHFLLGAKGKPSQAGDSIVFEQDAPRLSLALT